MKFKGTGVRKGSEIFFHTPTQNAKRLLLYPVAAGEFYCDENYLVERDRYDSFLLIYVVSGCMTLVQDGIYTAGQDEMLLADCYRPHRYFTDRDSHTLWLHFDGKMASEFVKASGNCRIQGKHKCRAVISDILRAMKEEGSEYALSSLIYSLLCIIAQPGDTGEGGSTDRIAAAKEYIGKNYMNPLTVQDMAGQANLSVPRFSKVFKDSTGISPYDYLLSVRLEKARELLQETDVPVSRVAADTGFNSDANFIYFFKKHTGLSPLKFRNMSF